MGFGEYLEQAIVQRNLDDLRGALKGIIENDPGFQTGRYDAAVRYAQSKGMTVYETHDPQYTMRQDNWDEAYFYLVLTYLTYNFSQQRIDHLKEVGRAVMKKYQPAATGVKQEYSSSKKWKASVPVIAAAVALVMIILIVLLASVVHQ